MRALLQLAGWGTAAAVALMLAVAAAYSSYGQYRLTTVVASVTGKGTAPKGPTDAANAGQLARLAETEVQTRRLSEMIRALSGDRERLLARVAVLERNLEDVTGSIRRQDAPAVPSEPPARPAPLPSAAAPPQPPAAAPASPASEASPPTAPPRLANVAPTSKASPTEAQRGGPTLGVEIGGAASFDGLRTLWNTMSSAHPSLFERLHPIVTVRENNKSRATELRLVAGPFSDAGAASRACETLAAAKRFCRPAAYEGGPLSLVAPEPPPRKAERKAPSTRIPQSLTADCVAAPCPA